MSIDDKKYSIAIPGEWALQKVLGPLFGTFGEDLNKLYIKGRDKIISAAYRKIQNSDDGKQANLRVTHDVLWNGSFTDDEICAEYFGGILASSRSADGKNDETIQYVDVIKSLSASQLKLHYVLYNTFNKLMRESYRPGFDVSFHPYIASFTVWFSVDELTNSCNLKIEDDRFILKRQGLVGAFEIDQNKKRPNFAHAMVEPTIFGIMLYAAAHNRLSEWKSFNCLDFGDFTDVALPKYFARELVILMTKVDILPPQHKN